MTASGLKSLSAIGFLTVLEDSQLGLFGGYLVLNSAGRPLEFHCTAPVKANRAQEILYGPTLEPYLYGEQIGKTLLEKAKVKPLLVCTDVEPAMSMRPLVSTPVVLMTSQDRDESSSDSTFRVDAAHQGVNPPQATVLSRFTMGKHAVAVASEYENDQPQAIAHWQAHFEGFDLREPFSRIREAIEEAQRSAR